LSAIEASFFWNLLFPVVLVAGFGFAFSGPGDALFTVATIGSAEDLTGGGTTATLAIPLLDLQQVEVVPYDRADREEVLERVRRHQLDMLIDFERGVFVLNSESNTAPVLRLLVGSGAEGILREESVSGAPIRYVDWLIPGIIGMNMMFSCLVRRGIRDRALSQERGFEAAQGDARLGAHLRDRPGVQPFRDRHHYLGGRLHWDQPDLLFRDERFLFHPAGADDGRDLLHDRDRTRLCRAAGAVRNSPTV
jgi:hypothetical protein